MTDFDETHSHKERGKLWQELEELQAQLTKKLNDQASCGFFEFFRKSELEDDIRDLRIKIWKARCKLGLEDPSGGYIP